MAVTVTLAGSVSSFYSFCCMFCMPITTGSTHWAFKVLWAILHIIQNMLQPLTAALKNFSHKMVFPFFRNTDKSHSINEFKALLVCQFIFNFHTNQQWTTPTGTIIGYSTLCREIFLQVKIFHLASTIHFTGRKAQLWLVGKVTNWCGMQFAEVWVFTFAGKLYIHSDKTCSVAVFPQQT